MVQSEWTSKQANYRDAFRRHMSGYPVSAKMLQAVLEAPSTDMRLSALAQAVDSEFDSSDLYARNLVSKAEMFVLGYRVPKLSHSNQSYFRRCDPIREYIWRGGPHRPPSQENEPIPYYILEYAGERLSDIDLSSEVPTFPLCAEITAIVGRLGDIIRPKTSIRLTRIPADGEEYVDGLSLSGRLRADRISFNKYDITDVISELRTHFMCLARAAAKDVRIEPIPEEVEITECTVKHSDQNNTSTLKVGVKLNPMEKKLW